MVNKINGYIEEKNGKKCFIFYEKNISHNEEMPKVGSN